MLTMAQRIPKKVQATSLVPVLPLVPEALPSLEEEKGKYISLELKNRADDRAKSAATYKKYIRKFEEGTPQEWIDLLKDLQEVWRQNSITTGQDRVANIRALVRGESLVSFETALEDARKDEEGNEKEVDVEIVQVALNAVTASVFPHRALEIQKLWMQRGLRKPFNLSTRKTIAALTRINNNLPFFPGASENDKFSDVQLIGILEWALPQAWRTKFDLDGYVPTLFSKSKLIEACEAIERNQSLPKDKIPAKKNPSENGTKNKDNKNTKEKKFNCSVHGKNATHNTEQCFTLQNKKKKEENVAKEKSKTFSSKTFCKEINLLSQKKGSSKQKVLDLYAAAIKREQKKLSQQKKRKEKEVESSDSDSDMSVHMTEKVPTKKKVKFSQQEQTDEEKAFLKKIREMDEEESQEVDQESN